MPLHGILPVIIHTYRPIHTYIHGLLTPAGSKTYNKADKNTQLNIRKNIISKRTTRSSADADNGLDAFSGQSRSITMALFF